MSIFDSCDHCQRPRQLYGSTMQAARLAQSTSLVKLAQQCGLSAPTLSRIENGSRMATDQEADAVASALGLPVAALCRPLVSERLGLSGFYHRKMSRAGSRAVNAIEHQCLLDVVAIRELISMVDLDIPDDLISLHADDLKGNVEQAANMVRLAWQVPRGPIRDLCSLVERSGCLVIHADFGLPEMDALYQKVRGVPPIFWVNSRKPLDRVRWSIAHELGHLVLHEYEPVDHTIAEKQADTFASAFLMPRAEFRSECPSRIGIPELVEMKRRWRCSMQAIVRRAKDVGRIDDRQYRNLCITISRRGWRTREPYPINGESPSLLARIIHEAMNHLRLNVEQLAGHLAIPELQLRSWMQPFPSQGINSGEDRPNLRLADGY